MRSLIEAAARRYFSKPASKLTLVEAATLAGAVQQPVAYDPLRNPNSSRKRRIQVLNRVIDEVIAIGGVAKKNPFVMQIVADVLNMTIKVAASEQTCALGSAMAASVVAGIYKDIPTAQKAMGGGFEKEYHPDPIKAKKYELMFRKYKDLGSFIEKNQIH